jgi:nitrate reductase cytochrome c-type subunit
MWSRFIGSSRLVVGLAIVGAVAIGLVGWAYSGSASANTGATCAAPEGHHGCHVDPTTTTAKPTTTTAKPTTTTAKPVTTTAKPTATTKAGTSTTGATTDTTASSSSTTGTATSSESTTTSSESTTTSLASTTSSELTTSSVPTTVSASPAGSEVPADPTTSLRYLDQNNCLKCHGDPSLTKKQADGTSISLYVDTGDLPQAVHRYQDCTACHTSSPHEVQTPLTKLSQAEKCGSCHKYQYGQYMNSVHGAPQPGGNSDPATCADCHSADANPHNVVRVLDPSASTYPKNIAQTCAKCHDDPALMDKYGIVEKVYDSYMRSFHGKAMKLSPETATIQQLDTATCVNCHGAHNIKAVADPAAPVAGMDNLLRTCQLCHPGAGPEFVNGFLGHKAANSDLLPEVYWGGTTFYIFSRAMLAGGVLIVATSISLRGVPRIVRKFKRRNKKGE